MVKDMALGDFKQLLVLFTKVNGMKILLIKFKMYPIRSLIVQLAKKKRKRAHLLCPEIYQKTQRNLKILNYLGLKNLLILPKVILLCLMKNQRFQPRLKKRELLNYTTPVEKICRSFKPVSRTL